MRGSGLDIGKLRDIADPSRAQLLRLVVMLSIPTVLSELTSIVMQYINAGMVGGLGANASAAIGLVQTSTWLESGICTCVATGFTVQVAQLVGAGKLEDARNVLRQALVVLLALGVLIGLVGVAISGALPRWLGGDPEIWADASGYFLVYSCGLPALQMVRLCTGMLQCSGNVKTPSIINVGMCFLDVMFNALFIFPSRTVSVLGLSVHVPGVGLGVPGAAAGPACAQLVAAAIILFVTCARSPVLNLRHKGSWRLRVHCLKTAGIIAGPMCLERAVMCGAQVASTVIVAPLGTIAVAANSLAVTAEGVCYMPGYGISAAATTLVGQSIGAGRRDLAKRFARLAVVLGMLLMGIMGVLLFVFAPTAMALLTPDVAVRELGASVLRIEAFAEPLFAASIVVAGALRGAGDTLVPSIMNLASMWGVRITASALLAPHLGLRGVWIAMCGELCVRGVIFLVRLLRGKWLERKDLVGR